MGIIKQRYNKEYETVMTKHKAGNNEKDTNASSLRDSKTKERLLKRLKFVSNDDRPKPMDIEKSSKPVWSQ